MKLYHFLKGSIYVALMSFIQLGLLKRLAKVDNATPHTIQERTKFPRFFRVGHVGGLL